MIWFGGVASDVMMVLDAVQGARVASVNPPKFVLVTEEDEGKLTEERGSSLVMEEP